MLSRTAMPFCSSMLRAADLADRNDKSMRQCAEARSRSTGDLHICALGGAASRDHHCQRVSTKSERNASGSRVEKHVFGSQARFLAAR
jgi:hypothetical protein